MKVTNVSALPVREVAVASIETEPGPYCMSFEFALERLMRSLEECGLINPLVLRERDDHRFDVVTGFRRLAALNALGRTRSDCRILPPSDHSPLQCLRIGLYDNIGVRQFNDVEKAMVLRRLKCHVAVPEILERYMPLLGLPPRGETLSLFLAMEQTFDRTMKRRVAMGRLSLAGVRALLALDAPDRSGVFSVIDKLNLNINEQIKLFEYINDISHEEGISIAALLKSQGLVGLDSSGSGNTPQQARSALRSLRVRRYPTLTKAEESFRIAVSRLSLPESTRITPPPFFEAPDYRLEIRFRAGNALRASLKYLAGMEGLETLTDPWEDDG